VLKRRATASKHECRAADFVPKDVKGLQAANGAGRISVTVGGRSSS
jgi:hypothetical protein